MDRIYNPVIQEEVIFLTTSKQTNGAKTTMQVTIGPKGGIPLHYHKKFSETFKVLEGQLNVQVGNQKLILNPGDEVTATANTHHRFYNTSGEKVKFTVDLVPASEGFENVLRIAFGLANDGKAGPNGMPKSPVVNGILMKMGEGYFVGMFFVLEKIFRLFANSDKAKDLEKDLLIKYCQSKNE